MSHDPFKKESIDDEHALEFIIISSSNILAPISRCKLLYGGGSSGHKIQAYQFPEKKTTCKSNILNHNLPNTYPCW